jgi:hypothetical protein
MRVKQISIYLSMKLITIGFLFFCYSSVAQTDSTIYFREFGWTIHLPSDFKIVDTASITALKNAGHKAIKESTGENVSRSATTDLITAKNGRYNYFVSNYTNTNSITAENWGITYDSVRQLILITLEKQIPIVPDTSTSLIDIDGVKFKKTEAIFKI